MTPGELLALVLLVCGGALIAISQLLLKEGAGHGSNNLSNVLESRPFIFWQAVSFCVASFPAFFIEAKPHWLPVLAMAVCVIAGNVVGYWRAFRHPKARPQQTRQQDA